MNWPSKILSATMSTIVALPKIIMGIAVAFSFTVAGLGAYAIGLAGNAWMKKKSGELFQKAGSILAQGVKDAVNDIKDSVKESSSENRRDQALRNAAIQKTRATQAVDIKQATAEAAEDSKTAANAMASAAENASKQSENVRKHAVSEKNLVGKMEQIKNVQKRQETIIVEITKLSAQLSQAVQQTEIREIRKTNKEKTKEEQLKIRTTEEEKREDILKSQKEELEALQELKKNTGKLEIDIKTLDNAIEQETNECLAKITGLTKEQRQLITKKVELKDTENTQQSEINELKTQFEKLQTQKQKGETITDFIIENEHVQRAAFEDKLFKNRAAMDAHINQDITKLANSYTELKKASITADTEEARAENAEQLTNCLMQITERRELQKQFHIFSEEKQKVLKENTQVEEKKAKLVTHLWQHKGQEKLRAAKEDVRQQEKTVTSQTNRDISEVRRRQTDTRASLEEKTAENLRNTAEAQTKIQNLQKGAEDAAQATATAATTATTTTAATAEASSPDPNKSLTNQS